MAGSSVQTTLGDLVVFRSGGTPSKAEPEYWEGTIPWVSAKDMKAFRLFDVQDHISDDGLAAGSRIAPAGSVLLLTRGMTLLSDIPICVVDRPMAFNQDVKALEAGPRLDSAYLPYLLLGRKHELLASVDLAGHGTGRLNTDSLKKLKVDLPPLPEQRRIAHILGTLDEKIELNRRINETLEEMARALFKSWFVDFEPVRAKAEGRDPGLPPHLADLFPDRLVDSELEQIPEGWRMTELSSLAPVESGGTPKTSVGEYWDGAIPWFSVVDAPAISDVWVTDTERHVTQAGVDSSAAEIVPAGSTILSARGTVGKVALAGTPMAFNQSCYGFVPQPQAAGYHTYFAVRTLVTTLKRRAHGSVFDTITRVTLAGVSVPRPPARLIRAYESEIGDVMQRIRTNRLESAVLQSVRDSLLPGLVAGTIRAKGRGAVPGP